MYAAVFAASPKVCSTPLAEPRYVASSMAAPLLRGRSRGAFTQHRRLDALRALLQRHPKGLTLEQLSGALHVSTRSLRRYLKEVDRDLDLESARVRPGGACVWRLRAADLPRKVEVRRTQAYALLAARGVFSPLKGTTLFEEIDLASQRLLGVARRPGRGPNAGVADARLEDRFLYAPFAPKDYAACAQEIDDLFQAVADLRPLRCTALIDGAWRAAVLHPYAMILYKDAVFCVAKDQSSAAVLALSVDRVRDTECVTSERFALPRDFRAMDWVQGHFGISRGGKGKRVVVDLDPSVAEVALTRRVHASQEVVRKADGGARLTITLRDLTEIATWILGFGEHARAVEPPELVAEVKARLARALALYE